MSRGRTPSQTVGPFYAIGMCRRSENELVSDGVELSGRLVDGRDTPISDGVVELWDGTRWGRSATDAEGRFSFRVAKPEPPPGEAPRLDAFVFARGLLRHQLTRIYFPDEEAANAADPVLAALPPHDRATLVAQHDDTGLRFDIHMQGNRPTVFFSH